jgi:N-acetylmuramoyl-L-alanine amidase
MNISQPTAGSFFLALLIIPILITSCAVIGGRPKGVGLSGKKIVLDPGHGGEHLGAVGLGGLKEKTPNLDVSRKLKKMLEKEGAKVYLTRERDDQTVSLPDRVAFTKKKKPDLFVSLHHNANAQVDRTIDRSELYYSWWSDGPSRDLANHLYAAFHRHIGLPQLPVRPAIYYVTRNNDEPCVLGEPSYISNPEREAKLRSENHQQEEAQAYYEGIKDFLDGGVPQITELQINDDVTQTGILTLQATILDEEGGLGIDPAGIELKVDDTPLSYHFDHQTGKLTAVSPEPLANGMHGLFLMARNRRGNATKPIRREFSVELPAVTLQLACAPTWAPVKGTFAIRVWATVLDQHGNPVVDGTEVTFVTDRGAPSSSADSTIAGRASARLTVKDPRGKALIFATCGKLYDRVEVQFDSTSRALVTGTLTNEMTQSPVAGAWVKLADELVRTDQGGHFLFENLDPGSHPLEVKSPGYLSHQDNIRMRKNAGHTVDIGLRPLYQGLLLDKSVVIDAEYGGDDAGAVGPAGLKASDVNLRVAQYLREYLIAAGATVHMTRKDYVETLDPVVRTRFVRRHNPNKLVSISHSNPYMKKDGSRCFHFYTDQEGKVLAERIQRHLVSYLGRPDLGVEEWSSYLMIEAFVDRALVTPTVVTDPAAEKRLKDTAHLRREAYAIFCGLLEDFGLDLKTTGVIAGTITDGKGKPVEGTLVVLDDAFALQTGPDGRYRFALVELGDRALTIHHPGYGLLRKSFKVAEGREIRGDFQLAEEK